jgi:hypothetical protein
MSLIRYRRALPYLSSKSLLQGFALRRSIRDEGHVRTSWPGLVVLDIEERVPTLSCRSFGPFIDGAAQKAEVVRETGPSSPQNWVRGFGEGHKHVLGRCVGDLEGENQRKRAQVGPLERSADGTQAAILRLEEPAST